MRPLHRGGLGGRAAALRDAPSVGDGAREVRRRVRAVGRYKLATSSKASTFKTFDCEKDNSAFRLESPFVSELAPRTTRWRDALRGPEQWRTVHLHNHQAAGAALDALASLGKGGAGSTLTSKHHHPVFKSFIVKRIYRAYIYIYITVVLITKLEPLVSELVPPYV